MHRKHGGNKLQNDILRKELPEIDWEFLEDDTRFSTHDYHRYPSKYIPQIASTLISRLSKKNDVVLDVFLGSGTTLIEANRLERNCIGVDLNPVAYLVSITKSTPINLIKMDKQISTFIEETSVNIIVSREEKELNNTNLINNIKKQFYRLPDFPYRDSWFQKQVLVELSIIRDQILEIKNKDIQRFFICAFSGIVRSVSNAASGFGNLMIDKNKKKILNPYEIFTSHLLKMRSGMEEYNKNYKSDFFIKTYQGDSQNLDFIANESIDCVVTHPPYVAAVPYAEYLKLSLLWLREFFPKTFSLKMERMLEPKELDKEIIGGRRNSKDVVERFNFAMQKVFDEMYRVLKKNKYCAIVIGNPVVKGNLIQCNKTFVQFGKNSGFKFICEVKRGKHRTTMGKMKEEFILLFQK